MQARTVLYSLILVVELGAFIYLYLGGSHGMLALRALETECSAVHASCDLMRAEIQGLRGELGDWKEYPFYKELQARHKLHMAHPREELYRYE